MPEPLGETNMELQVVSSGRSFSGYLHYVILDDTDYLVVASYAGFETAVRAISSSVIEGRNITVLQDGKSPVFLQTLAGEYRRVEKQVNGPIFHGVMLGKAAVFEENKETPVVIAWDGDIRNAVGRFMAARYTLPREWIDQYFSLIPPDGIEVLKVIVNPLNNRFKAIKAIRISSNYATDDYVLAAVDSRLQSGKLAVPAADPMMPRGRFVPGWSMREYLTNNAHVLAAQLKNVRPRHVPGQDPLNPEIAEMARVPFPSQAHMIQGLYNTIRQDQHSEFCGADMGCGKSIIALGVAHLMHKAKGGKGMSVLLVVPGITVPKWINKEIKKTLPDAKVRVLTSTSDAARYVREVKNGYKPDCLEFVIVGMDRAKLGPEPWPAAIWKRVAGEKYKAWHCPDCGRPLTDPEAEEDGTLAYWNTLAMGLSPEETGYTNSSKTANNLPVGFPVQWRRGSKLKQCQCCYPKHKGNGKLRRPALKNRGETQNKPRYFISLILKKLRRHFDLLIYDEIQKAQAESSGRGDAFAQMVKAAKASLKLTGTLVNGKSTSIKEILWRTDPKALLKEGFNHKSGMVAWASRYGVLKKITRVTEEDTGYVTRQKRVQLQPVEEPGIAPQMIAQFLLHKAAFMELGDLGLPLVNKIERPVFVNMDPDHEKHYRAFHNELYENCKRAMALGAKGAFSRFIPATIAYGNRPGLGASVRIGSQVITAPQLDGFHAKERLLVEMVKKELAEDRGVIIYAYYTDSYGVHFRLRDVLNAHGIESQVLTSSVASEKRVDWLAQKEKEGAKVI